MKWIRGFTSSGTETVLVLAITAVLLLGGRTGWAQKYDDQEHTELAKALKGTRMSLEEGLLASEREGTSISGKFEVEDGELQLSVYTMKGDKFSEVIVDHKTGKVVKVEAITDGEDLTAAQAQSEAIAQAQLSLRAALDKALKTDKEYRAVSVIPSLKEGHPVAEITLIKGEEFKTVSEELAPQESSKTGDDYRPDIVTAVKAVAAKDCGCGACAAKGCAPCRGKNCFYCAAKSLVANECGCGGCDAKGCQMCGPGCDVCKFHLAPVAEAKAHTQKK